MWAEHNSVTKEETMEFSEMGISLNLPLDKGCDSKEISSHLCQMLQVGSLNIHSSFFVCFPVL
jgi:hypothetical protein